MKYRIGNAVINADHIIQSQYFYAGQLDGDGKSHCGIALTGVTDGWSFWLNGDEADAFWEVYGGDAINVMAAPAKDYSDAR